MPKFMDHLDDHERNSGFGLVRTVYMMLGAAGSVVTGLVADLFGWTVAFGLALLLVGMLAVLLSVMGRERADRPAPVSA
jgi:MFS family permease